MRSLLALLLSCSAGVLSAQSPIPSAPPVPSGALAKPGLEGAEVGQLDGFYGFDTDASGRLWATAASYKVAFAEGGPMVLPFLGSTAPRSFPTTFSLRSVRIGGEPLALAAAPSPTREGQRVTYDHRTVQQCYDLRDSALEQSFRFDHLPQRGSIEVTIGVASELSPTVGSDGIAFHGEFGGLHYGTAVAIDGHGKRCAVSEELREGAIVLSVPAAFVATATLPLVIDPVINSLVTLHNNTRVVTSTDVVYLDNRSEYWTCFERTFSQTDTDVYVVRSNQAMGTVGAVITVDATVASWRHARMAGLDTLDRCLVVAEQSTGNVSPFAVVGRIVTGGATPAPLPAFDIQRVGTLGHSSFEGIHPDVGGDPGQASTTQWAVVWEKAYSAADHDICLRAVAADGTLAALYHTIDNATTFEHDPVISKSNGSGWTSSKFWAIAYRRDTGNGLGATRVGIADSLGAPQGTFPIGQPNTSPADGWAVASPLRPSISSPQPGGAYLLAESVVAPSSQITEVWVTPFSPQGVVLAPAMRLSNPQKNCGHPRACSDTMRFAVTYQETFTVIPQDDDIRVATVAYQFGQLYLHENVAIAESWEMESSPRITSRAEGGEVVTSPNMAIVWSHTLPNGTFSIEGRAYEATAPAGGITVRPTGCGSLQVTASGTGAIGTSFGIQLVNPANLSGFVIGTPTTAAIPICPTCTQGVVGNTMLTSGYGFGIPFAPALVGATFAFQGFDFGMGPCLGMIRLSDTVDLTLR